jgi:hypothetical protein
MDLKDKKKCDLCGIIYSITSFDNMIDNGARSFSQIELDGDKLDLCPKCANKVYLFLTT